MSNRSRALLSICRKGASRGVCVCLCSWMMHQASHAPHTSVPVQPMMTGQPRWKGSILLTWEHNAHIVQATLWEVGGDILHSDELGCPRLLLVWVVQVHHCGRGCSGRVSELPTEHCPWGCGASIGAWPDAGALWWCLVGLSLAGAGVVDSKLPKVAVANEGNSARG